MSFGLKEKKILVTGASGGIGSAAVRYLDSLGAALAISGTSQEKLCNLNSTLQNEAKILPLNLSELEKVPNLVDDAHRELGGLDGLVCNAGITADTLGMRMSIDQWQKVIDVNLTSSFFLNKQACRTMLRQKYGRIVNISSVVAFTGNPGQSNYCAAKAGMIGFSKSLAKEFAAKNILINCVAPGFIDTNMTSALNDDQKAQILENIPMKRMAQAHELCGIIAFLLSDLASYITGQTFHVNGGMYMV